MLSIVSLTSSIAVLTVPPCLIATIRVFSKFGALGERSYNERIQLQILKKLREGKNAVREFRRCEERGHMSRCLVICINLVKIYYVHARIRYILLCHESQASYITCVAYTSHACGAGAGFSNILAAGGSKLVPASRTPSPSSTIATAG